LENQPAFPLIDMKNHNSEPPISESPEADPDESDFDVSDVEIMRPTDPGDLAEILTQAAMNDDIEIEFSLDDDDPSKSIIVVKKDKS